MLVNQILNTKGEGTRQNLITIEPDQTVMEAIKLLAKYKIGAVVVSKDGRKAAGILSERDIVRAMGANKHDLRAMPIAELMTPNVKDCKPGDDIMTVLERMTEGRFRHMPVVDDDGDMVGLISIGDAVSARLSELHAETDALTGMIMGA